MKKNITQRTLSSTTKLHQQESDDPRRGGKVCFEEEKPGSTDVSGISNNHEQNNITEDRILGDTIHTSTGKLNSNEDAVFSIIRNLSKKGYDLVSSFIGRRHTEKGSETAASSDSDDLKEDRNYIRKEYSEPNLRGLNIVENNNTSKVPTGKDGSKSSVNQHFSSG